MTAARSSPPLRRFALPLVWLAMFLRLRWGMRWLERVGILPTRGKQESHQETFLIAYLTKHLGDLVLMLPVIEALRSSHPSVRIEVAVQKSATSLFKVLPAVDRVWGFDLPGDSATTYFKAIRLSWRITGQYLELMGDEAPPDVCILPRWGDDGLRSRELAYLTRAPRRIGFDWPMFSDRLPFAEQSLTEAVSGGNGVHEPTKPFILLQKVGLLPETDLDALSSNCIESLRRIAASMSWDALAQRLGIEATQRFAVIAPGAADIRRTWPLERWAEVGQLLQEMGLLVITLSGPADAENARKLDALLQQRRRGRSLAVAGITSIPETVTLLSHCAIFLGADSGPGHVAGALGVPTVGQFITVQGSDPDCGHAPERFRPAGPHVTCVQIPRTIEPCVGACLAEHQHCILTIETSEMLAVVRREAESLRGWQKEEQVPRGR